MTAVRITTIKNGPYKVEGAIELSYDGAPVATPGAATFLCRCGASSKKPFCDGTHSKIGFKGANEAVQEADPDAQSSGGSSSS